MVLDLDLNVTPSEESWIWDGYSISASSQEVQAGVSGLSQLQPRNNVEAIDDDVIISSPRSFNEARNNSRRNNVVIEVLDDDTEVNNCHSELLTKCPSSCKERIRALSNQVIMEGSNKNKKKKKSQPPELPQSVLQRKEPTFECPVCMCRLIDETSTKCGHIFCKGCINAAITAHKRCPTCRKKLGMKDIFRVYLPTAL